MPSQKLRLRVSTLGLFKRNATQKRQVELISHKSGQTPQHTATIHPSSVYLAEGDLGSIFQQFCQNCAAVC